MIFLDRSKNIFILLKYNNNEFLIYNLQTDNMETWNKERLINNSINHYYYLDFAEKHFFDITWFVPTFYEISYIISKCIILLVNSSTASTCLPDYYANNMDKVISIKPYPRLMC